MTEDLESNALNYGIFDWGERGGVQSRQLVGLSINRPPVHYSYDMGGAVNIADG